MLFFFQYRDYEFGINHYAGQVVYDANSFVQKNMDTLPTDLLECVKKSSNSLICEEFSKKAVEPIRSSPKPTRGRRAGGSISSQTVWTKFKTQLLSLMENISSTRTRYIRCVKPNQKKQPKIMEPLSTVEQLRCAGVVAAVTISRAAFPNRLPHHVVLEKFSSLVTGSQKIEYHKDENKSDDEYKKDVIVVLSTLFANFPAKEDNSKEFVCGKTKVYFKAGALEFLEQERMNAMAHRIIVIQRYFRGYIERSKYVSLRSITIKVQAKARCTMYRRRYRTFRMAAIVCQSFVRTFIAKNELLRLKREWSATMLSNW